MKITIKAEPKEIAELIKEIQARQERKKSPRKLTITAGDKVVLQRSYND